MPDQIEGHVAVVGAGPTGLTLAILLAQQGHDVVVLERHEAPYALPRAVVFDSEAARGLAATGIAERFGEICETADDYTWLDADGEVLLRLPMTPVGLSGWPDGNMMTQPVLEGVLAERAAELPNLRLVRGAEVTEVQVESDGVVLTTAAGQFRTAYAIGADGASSFVRSRMGATTLVDLGFLYDWLVVDLILDDQSRWVPMNRQVCDPARPTTMVSGGPGRRRWEFQRMPGDPDTFNTDEYAWELLARWGVTPDDARLERRALYTFAARWADVWRDGRLLIAGDAAHQMPPFAGMGMCSGIRDAVNLAWKLDMVLRGVSAPALLDTYSSERSAHVRNAIGMSVELGRVICETDPAIVAGRNAHLRAAGGDPAKALPPVPPATLGRGALQSEPDGQPLAPAGQVAPQPWLRSAEGKEGRFDDLVGRALTIFVDADVVSDVGTSAQQERTLKELGGQMVALTSGAAAPGTFAEIGTGLLAAMRAASYEVAVVRPDFYFYGGARRNRVDAMLADLATDLRLGRADKVREES